MTFEPDSDYGTRRGDTPGGTWVSDGFTYGTLAGGLHSEPATARFWIDRGERTMLRRSLPEETSISPGQRAVQRRSGRRPSAPDHQARRGSLWTSR